MTRLVAIVFGVCSVLLATAQERFTLSGYVRDSLSGETLIGATVAVNGHGKSIVSNQFGFYSITLPRGTYPVFVSFAGYQPVQRELTLDKNIEQSFYLTTKPVLQEVIVSARRRDGNVTNAQMGKIDLSINQVKSLPVVLGETDLLKTLQLLPGVRNAGEGNTGLYVRGGGPDQNLILLDDAIVYNSGHLFGFFSIFNSDAIKNISLVKGGMAAQYGGRLSSVLDVAMKEGNLNKFEVEGGIGAIASRLSIQGPIKKNKSSFIISGRRTYIDLLAKPFIKPNSDFYGSGYYFYDFNAKVNYIFSEKDRLYLSGYVGRDVFTYRNARRVFKADIPWGNSTATLRWNHVFNQKLFANTTLVYNDYAFSFGATQNDFNIKLSSGIHDWNAKTDFDFYPSTRHKVRFGAAYTYHTFTPNVLSGNQGDNQFSPDNAMRKYAGETGIYVQDEWDLSERIKVNAGLRYSRFVQLGSYKIFSTDINGNKTDSISYGRNKPVKAYDGFEPRLTLRYAINDETSLKAAVTRNLQYIHLVSNAGSTLPTDLWVPSTYRVKPQESWQYAAGLFKNFNDNMLETSLEVYYKRMNNQIEYREGYTPALKDPENDFVFGKGWSYGTELFINKTKGKLTGWIGYTLSWTWRQFDTLNEGKKYPSKYDRRHDLSVVATYQLNKKWKLSGVFVYGSGNAISLPERFYVVGGILTQEYSRINQYRLAPYHRMDLSAIYTPRTRPNQKFQTNWVFSLYNVYNRLNPYFIYFSQEGSPYDGTLNIKTDQVSLFPIIPSVTWNFRF
ncbi:TonB-dependent receptor [Niastella yeongjuensis]|uniref:TonB-dependent receptor n=1 Tax=Niastella yeongjuensis TaxID=354355 RepID=A0A1V9E541_9BACT|nr:TonB-dependent receptor [Niastella yeongjuensis]OQP41035.1 TonB-dependent receptor [Niastella yeongjuensis]SEO94216.1 Outer membrane receptor proteins, mostly Fe transport [Niastella yeongjuensis]